MNEYSETADTYPQPEERQSRWARFIAILNWRNWTQSAEASYLAALRYLALVAATLFIVLAIVLLIWGAAVQLRSTDVKPKALSIAGGDLASAISTPDTAATTSGAEAPAKPKGWEQYLSAQFRSAYYDNYNKNFASYRREGDARLDEKAFFDTMFPEETLDDIDEAAGFDIDRSSVPEGLISKLGTGNLVLLTLYNSVDTAATDQRVKNALQSYRSAQKAQVCRNVTENNRRTVRGWDINSTACYNWYEYPYGCSVDRSISVPTTRRVCSMQFPENLASPISIMKELQQQYFIQLEAKHIAGNDNAAMESSRIMAQKAQGMNAIGNSGKALIAFLAIMFLYLLIAIERHYRVISRREGGDAN